MSQPDSFCFISTFNSSHELVGMLLSLSIHHNNSKVYGLVDSKTNELINNFIPKIQLQLFLKVAFLGEIVFQFALAVHILFPEANAISTIF